MSFNGPYSPEKGLALTALCTEMVVTTAKYGLVAGTGLNKKET